MTDIDLEPRAIYRDQLVIVLDKPAGIPCHAGPSGIASIEDALEGLRFGYKETPRLAHRLDRDTSGCLVLGRNARAMRKLGRLFSGRDVRKTYWAIVDDQPKNPSGLIDAPLAKLSDRSGWRMVADAANGRPARTRYRTLGADAGRALLELSPETGRTHQIRVHCAEIGCPVVGDPMYGTGQNNDALLLHARRIVFPMADDKPPIDVTAEPPDAFRQAMTTLKLDAALSPG